MELDLAEDPRIADEDEEEAESAEVYVEHLELREVEERLSRRPALPPLPPLPRRRTSGPAAAEVERQLNQILKGICVKGHFSVQSSNERSDTVARASLVVEEGPSELLNRVVRVYSLKDRNRAKQGDHVWVELRSCVLDRAALERGGPKTRWTMSEALSYVCIFGAVLRASTPAGVAAQRSCYLCKQSQMQWKPGVLNFIPFSHEVPILQVMVEGEDREQPLDEVFQLMMVDWPVNRLRPLAVIVEKLPVPRPLSLERSLEIFLKDLDFLQDPEDPKVQEMADEAVDLMTPEEELELVDASRRELDGQIFSIDAAGASIIDDALEYDLEEQVVRVHIADVAALVCSGGDLDLHAARRGCSVFIRDHHEELQRCEPMLPACVTFQTSLEKNQWRRALTFEFRVGEQLQFRGFFRSWVRSKEQLSFQDAEGLMGGMEAQGTTPGTSGVRRSLRALWQWTRAELEKRKAQGRAALQAFLSTASSRNSQEGHAESLVEFWMRQVNEESGGILAQHSAISYCFPCPDAHHFSRLAILCREALLRAGHAAQDELLLKLRSSPEECQESLADILSHVTRLTGRTAQRPNRWRSTARAATGEVTQGVSVLCQQLSQCVPIAQYRMKPSGETHWPILQQSQHYFQVTSPMRRWIDLLGQHLLLGTCQLDFEEMAQYVESFNEMSLLAKQTSSRFAFLSFCRELQQSERQMECVVTRIDQGTLHLACPDMAGFHGQMVLPLQLLSSHDLQVRPIIEEKKAIVTRVDDAKQLELRPFHSKMQVQLSLDQSSPVSLYRLCASALFLDFRDGSRAFRHAVLARQHPEVFGPVPDLRKAREMHRAGGLWGSTWQQVRQAQMCAAALMPQMRAKAPYHMTASYEELENFCFVGNRSEGYEVYVTVPSSYRGLRGLNKLQVGHLALLWRSDRGKLWMCCGAVKDIDVTEQMKRKTELCTRFARNGTCEYEDCWYAHGSDELIPERAKVTLRLSDCSARLLPAWAASNSGALDVDFAAISSREQLALKSIREVERTSRQPQQLVNRLVFRGRGPGGWHAPAIADEAPIDTPAGLPPLNNYQQKALQLTLKEVLAYVQGPPGTGKSTTAAHLICQLLLRPPQRGAMVKPLLVCCPSNKACDRLLHLFLKAEMSRDIWVVRVYAKTIEQNYWRDPRSQCCRDYEIDPDLLQYALHQQVEDQDPSFKQQYLDIAQELEDYCTKPGELLKVQKTLTEAKQTKELKSKEILKQAQVIFTTCDCACNDRLFQRMTFPSVIIDEAAQALEPELARCCLLAEDHLALFGDHEQLGPVLTEQTLFPAFKNMWTQSLFERIVSKRPGRQSNSPTTGIPHVTLKRQYRMHPSISCFANEEFYQCQLVDDEEAYRDGFTLPSEFNSRMSVIDVTGAHGRKSVAPEGDAVQDFETSLCNPSEAAVVKAYVTWLVALGVRVGEIGVVTPYRAQAALIKEVLTEALSNVSELPSIGTVHLLQGEERQYVILSLVRSFAEADTEVFDPVPQDARRRKVYSLGFLNDRRLANVALTRAQLGLVVVANTQVLSSASHWKNLFEHARNNRCYWDQDAAMDFFQSGEAPATSDSYWAEVRSQSPLASGSESEGHAEASASASEASEASAFGSAPSSAASVAAAPEAPPVSAPAPVARRRRAKRSKAKAKAKAASQARRDREADDAEILEEALAETSAPLSPTTERERRAPAVCCVAECRIRPHQRSPFASAHGLCSAHWIELLKETNVLEQMDVDGLSPHSLQWPVSSMERFILPTYWNPLPPIVGDLGLRSRSFFSVLLRYLETKTQTSPESPSLDVLFTLAFTESIRSAKQLQMSPEDFLHTAAIGLLLALQAIEDCAGEVPSQFQERWQQLSGRRQSQQSYQEDLLAIATFWKEEGNRHKQKRHLPGEFQLALDSYAVGSELLEEEEANRLQDLLLQATPPFGR